MMKKKLVLAFVILIALIILAAFSAMSIIQQESIADVENPAVVSVSQNSAVLHWERVNSADGYYIYKSYAGKENFEKAATVLNAKTQQYTVKDLEQAREYVFYITAFRNSRELIESKGYQVISLCTQPKRQKLVSVDSNEEGVLSLEWKINSSAKGYKIQLVKGREKDFSSAQTIDVENNKKGSKSIKKLEPNEVYTARVCSYVEYNDAIIDGEWSEALSITIAEKIKMDESIDPSKPMVALTFDDGPGYNSASDKILDVLEKYNAKATFFMVGKNAKDHPKNLKRKLKLGCELGNHTWDHNHYGSNVTAKDIKKASDAIYVTCGQWPTAFRSPGGNTTKTILKECKKENLTAYHWSLDTLDWKLRDADKIYDNVINNVSDGDIILMHEIYMSTAEAVEKIVPKLLKEGYQLVTCSELITAKTGKYPEIGKQYINSTEIQNKTS